MKGARHKINGLSRKPPTKQPYDLVLIVCEGEVTEPNYFEDLIDDEGLSSVNIKITGDCGSDPLSVVNYAIALFEARAKENNPGTLFDKVYCLIDRDEHANFDNAIQKAKEYTYENKKNIITIIDSYPCFEYWYLCHFIYSRAFITKTSNKTACDNCIASLNPRWKRLFKSKYDKNSKSPYTKLSNLTDTAIKNAEIALKDALATGQQNPSTKVHELVKYLLTIKK